MKINNKILRKENQVLFDASMYALPETIVQLTSEQKAVQDKCFSPIESLLNHGLGGVMAEGVPAFLGYGILTTLAQNGLIRAGVEVRADDMTSKWGKFIADGEDKDDICNELEKESEKYGIKKLFNKASAYCGYYGGCLGYINTGDDDLANPLVLTPETIRIGSLKGIKLVAPYVCTPAYYNSVNPLADDYFKPSVWYVQGVPVHASRMIYFAENELPTLVRPAYNFFGLPLAQKVLDAVSHFTSCRESVARLLEKYSLTIFKTDMEQILSGGMDDTLRQRVEYFCQMRSNDGCATIDMENEDLVVQTTSLSGTTDVVRQAQEYVAAMFNTPVTKMWGLSPSGFNTGDSDLRQWYNNIESLQSKMFTEPMQRITKLLQLNKYGFIDNSIKFEFEPLTEEDKISIANQNKTKADIDALYIEQGVIRAEEARERIINDPESGYNGLVSEDFPQEVQLDPFDPIEPLEGE